MENKDREILFKILKHSEHAIEYTSKYNDRSSFEADEMCVEATVFNLMQIGELAKSWSASAGIHITNTRNHY
jgi:uncharacterized protein with HEPN domain